MTRFRRNVLAVVMALIVCAMWAVFLYRNYDILFDDEYHDNIPAPTNYVVVGKNHPAYEGETRWMEAFLAQAPLEDLVEWANRILEREWPEGRTGATLDHDTAVRIAAAIRLEIYESTATKNRPWHLLEKERYVFVHGTLPEGWVGGVPEIIFDKQDKRVVRVIHSL